MQLNIYFNNTLCDDKKLLINFGPQHQLHTAFSEWFRAKRGNVQSVDPHMAFCMRD